jgi:CARDB/Receptor family ligand binding region
MRLKQILLFVLALCVMLPIGMARLNAQTSREINIGILDALDGATTQGVSLAIEQVNKAGGLKLPDGSTARLTVTAADARNPQEVAQAVDIFLGGDVAAVFAPSDDTLMAASQSIFTNTNPQFFVVNTPIITSASSNAVTIGRVLFRSTADDTTRYQALAKHFTDAGERTVVAYATDPIYADKVNTLGSVFDANQMATTLVRETDVAKAVQGVLAQRAQAVVAFAAPTQAAEFYTALRGAGFKGNFAFFTYGQEEEFFAAVPFEIRKGVLSVNGWSYASATAESQQFAYAYSVAFGKLPNEQAAAAYDATTGLLQAITLAGVAPEALTKQLTELPAFVGVQGEIFPATGGQISNNVLVSSANSFGVPNVIAAYQGVAPITAPMAQTPVAAGPTNTPRSANTPTITGTARPTTVPTTTRIPSATPLPSATPIPSATPLPTQTPLPTATPDGVTLTVLSNVVNVRVGPGQSFERIGQLRRGEQVRAIGANADFTWIAFMFREQMAWVSAAPNLVSIFGDVRTLPFIAPPTPVPATATPTPLPLPDLFMVSATMVPPIAQPGVPFTVQVVVGNQGTAVAGEFAVATSFLPGNVFASATVPAGLQPGQQVTVNLTATVAGTGIETVAIVLDLNTQVQETDENNNKPAFAYKVDRALVVSNATVVLAPGGVLDLFGGTIDLTFDTSSNLVPNPPALFGLPGVQASQVHYDLLSPSVVNSPGAIAAGSLTPNLIIGVQTAEGQRAYIRIIGFSGPNLQLEYNVYAP